MIRDQRRKQCVKALKRLMAAARAAIAAEEDLVSDCLDSDQEGCSLPDEAGGAAVSGQMPTSVKQGTAAKEREKLNSVGLQKHTTAGARSKPPAAAQKQP